MLVLDTNVVSESFRPRSDPRVADWFLTVARDTLFLTSVTKAELLFGLAVMPPGSRKAALGTVIWRFLVDELSTEILSFDTRASEHYADIASRRRASGRPISQSDAQIAAIARASGFALVTRNVRDFEDTGVAVVNPWEHPVP